MAIRTVVDEKGVYFITFTCHRWLPLLERTNSYTAVYKFFDVLKDKGHDVVGFVIMPNHIHLLLHYVPDKSTLNTLIGNGKRFLAYEIVRCLEQAGEMALLSELAAAVESKDPSRGKKHEVWQAGFDIKPCRTEKFLLQKLNYIHQNPVSGKWSLAASAAAYLHSSARFYLRGEQGLWQVRHYEKVLDWVGMYP